MTVGVYDCNFCGNGLGDKKKMVGVEEVGGEGDTTTEKE